MHLKCIFCGSVYGTKDHSGSSGRKKNTKSFIIFFPTSFAHSCSMWWMSNENEEIFQISHSGIINPSKWINFPMNNGGPWINWSNYQRKDNNVCIYWHRFRYLCAPILKLNFRFINLFCFLGFFLFLFWRMK